MRPTTRSGNESGDVSSRVSRTLRSSRSKNCSLYEKKPQEQPGSERIRSERRGSPILTGSDTKYRDVLQKVREKVPRIRLEKILGPGSPRWSDRRGQSDSEDIGEPMTCSSFVGGYENSRDPVSRGVQSDRFSIPMEITEIPGIAPPVSDTMHTSLGVNTSVDRLSTTAEVRGTQRTSIGPKNDNPETETTDEISLRVNTSVRTEEPSPTRGNDENISPVTRSRNVSAVQREGPDARKSSSFVEVTPYPASRSALWKTQIRFETLNARRNAETIKRCLPAVPAFPDDDSSRAVQKSKISTNNTILLGDSSCGTTVMLDTVDPRIIPDSSEDDDDDEKPERAAVCTSRAVSPRATNVVKRGKRRLLPLRESLEPVYLSPVSTAIPSPKRPIVSTSRTKARKRKTAAAKKLVSELEKKKEREQQQQQEPASCDDDDDDGDDETETETQRVKAKAKKPRKVISKRIVVKKIADLDILRQLEKTGPTSLNRECTQDERSSIGEFSKRKTSTRRNNEPRKLVIVTTGFSKGDADLVKSIAKELGGAEINRSVTRRTSHVVTTGVRTINLLRGIIRGCWLVTLDWVLQSLEHRKWLDADRYEILHFSKAVRENRRDRELFGHSYVPELFASCGSIYIENETSPPMTILKELVETAGGRVIGNPKNARLTVGQRGLREIWILDSITTGELQSTDRYEREKR